MAKADGKNLEKLIENKFYCAKRFTEAIETLAHEKDGMSYVCLLYTSDAADDC